MRYPDNRPSHFWGPFHYNPYVKHPNFCPTLATGDDCIFPVASVFKSEPLPPSMKESFVRSGMWKEGCPVPLERLSLLTVSYVDFCMQEHDDGKLIVLDSVVPFVLNIFKALYNLRFPFAQIGYTKAASKQNISTTDTFSCREITGGGKPSIHSYGLAIDVNPMQNPYILTSSTEPPRLIPGNSGGYLNRGIQRPGMVEPIVPIFARNGFTVWGGDWRNPIDYMHFQPPRKVAEILAMLNREDGTRFFALYNLDYHRVDEILDGRGIGDLTCIYRSSREEFFELFEEVEKGNLSRLC